MEKEELLIKRYRIIMDYPYNPCNVGDVVTQHFFKDGSYIYINKNGNHCRLMNRDLENEKFSYLFEKIDWWEERKEEELPEYILVVYKEMFEETKLKPEVYKCFKWFNKTTDVYPYVNKHCSEVVSMGKGVYPATEKEYVKYQRAQAKIKI